MARALQILTAVFLSLFAAAAQAVALQCGTTLYQSVTLTADIVCPPGVDALKIGNHKVRIDLNGFSIRGPFLRTQPTAAAFGIISSGYDSVQIVGPGTIEGFLFSVRIISGSNHLLSGVDVLIDAGEVHLWNVSGSRVTGNHLPQLTLLSSPPDRATGNQITRNTFSSTDLFVPGGITLAGCNTADNVVANNGIRPDYSQAVSLVQGANANQVLKNRIENGWVSLVGASNNLIAGNSITNAFAIAGIHFESGPGNVCVAGPGSTAKNNVRDNRINGAHFGVYLDDANDNLVTGNVFSDQYFVALVFRGSNNDARRNTYINVPVIAYDYGTGNLWP